MSREVLYQVLSRLRLFDLVELCRRGVSCVCLCGYLSPCVSVWSSYLTWAPIYTLRFFYVGSSVGVGHAQTQGKSVTDAQPGFFSFFSLFFFFGLYFKALFFPTGLPLGTLSLGRNLNTSIPRGPRLREVGVPSLFDVSENETCQNIIVPAALWPLTTVYDVKS